MNGERQGMVRRVPKLYGADFQRRLSALDRSGGGNKGKSNLIKKWSLPFAGLALALSVGTASAGDVFDDPGVMVGLAFKFGGSTPSTSDVGITAKVLSNRNEETFVVGAGVTLYPFAKQPFGLDVSVGYNFDNVTVMGGYDILQLNPQLSVGWSNTKEPERPVAEEAPPVCLPDFVLVGGICTPT